MLRIRRLEERCAQLYGEQKIRGFLHLYIGEEAVAAGVMPSLRPQDNVVATYREHGHALARGVPAGAIMAEMFGKREGCSGGRGGSMHLFDRATRFYGGNAIVGGGLTLAAGLALADVQLQREGCVTACFFGEGAVAEGAFHESLNLAALWRLPVLFVCENNLYAMGTALCARRPRPTLCAKAAAYGMATARRSTAWTCSPCTQAAHAAVAQVREQRAPLFLELHTYRFRAHSMFDAELYRDKREIEGWKQHGPIHTFTGRLKEAGMMDEADFAQMDREAMQEVDEAVAFAEAGTWERAECLLDDVVAR
ncbi:thiamine pyrophosphate-dependent enzyme [Piscinibacter sp.]|uniref:thiamine pyrophosphate-dependent enzyme n=1 Tax=Piscinibacter sp. TaxID=1903157 RepID=UPI001DC4A166|nr:thiamine pyrophosphate-dependent enzyme [Piscinibacter sp.]MBK7530425.1 pyruvate dehydrogenase (acetyl-transferring) E1 component subunit alpha [Piscinibacter sp.]